MFVRDLINIDSKIEDVIFETIVDLNDNAGEDFIFYGSGGEKPITFRTIPASEIGEDVFAHARYLEYHCLIQVRSDLELRMRSIVNPNFPHLVSESQWMVEAKKIIMHELGHCAGLGHVNNSQDLMNPTYSTSWNQQVLNTFARLLRDITR